MAQLKYPRLSDLDFGRLSAEEEARSSPDLLMNGFWDFQEAAYRVARHDAWLIVGPKGSGKSAIFEHLALKWEQVHNRFIEQWELSTFPVVDVTALKIGSNAGPTSTRGAWKFLLLLKIFNSLVNDNSAEYRADVTKLKNELVASGLIGGVDLRTRFADWSKSTFKFNVTGIGAEGSVTDAGATAMQLSAIIERAIRMIATPASHILAVDGLDSFFAQSELQLESLAALVEAAGDVNTFLADTELQASVVLAIRSDMFTQLPSTDSAKLTEHAVEIDWTRRGIGDGNELWDLLNAKAKASIRASHTGLALGDIRRAYLAEPIKIRRYGTIPNYFLSHTRLLPRDLVALLTELKKHHPRSGPVSEKTARDVVRFYSETYFVREIQNNLSKVLPRGGTAKVNDFLDAMTNLEGRRFRAAELRPHLPSDFHDDEVRALLKQLYVVGGIGVRAGRGSMQRTNFAFRRPAAGGFSIVKELVVHDALVEAWNLDR